MDVADTKEAFTRSSTICRLCLIPNSTYSNIFDNTNDQIIDAIRNLIGISVSPQDNWPKTICFSCTNKIHEFRKFQSKVRQNESHLTEVFGDYQLQDEVKDLTLHIGTAVFLSSGSNAEVKEELSEDPIKEEDSDSNGAFDVLDSDVKDEDIKPPRELRKRGRKRKSSEEFKLEDVKQEPSSDEDTLEENRSAKKRKVKVVVSKEIDADIHTFYKMECELCQGFFPRFSDLQKHFRKDHNRRGYVVCCGKKLNSPKKLQVHMNNHKNPPKYECKLCQKNYKSEDTLLMHRKLQHTPVEERKFCCDKCPRRFALGGALRRHMIVHVADEDKKHICTTCGQAFAVANILANHIRRVHENACISVCDICAKVYRHKYLFEKHMLEHKNELKPTVPCPVCGRLFTYRLAMQRHLRRHNKSGSLECHICRHVSANQQALREHIKLNHMERKLFECSLCERIFRTRKALKEHMASHTGQVLYVCPYCSKQFNNNANYYSHKKNVHPVEWQADREKRLAAQPYQVPEIKKDQKD